MGAFQTQMEVTSQKFQELQNKAMDGKLDEESQKQMEALAKQMMEQSLQGAGMMGTVFKAMLPALGISFILSMLIAMLAKSYFVVIAVKGLSDPVNAVQTAIAWLVPLIGLWAWLFLRSFVWIPIA
ncbi:hypothetical protein EXS70_05255, partial [Candidatus Peribacteria bacterium]|nr:hypothetical protein [Candidatus Peribacteria bacterium]